VEGVAWPPKESNFGALLDFGLSFEGFESFLEILGCLGFPGGLRPFAGWWREDSFAWGGREVSGSSIKHVDITELVVAGGDVVAGVLVVSDGGG
jgi:hypothetical protein